MDSTELDINIIIASLKDQIGLLSLDKAMLTAKVADLQSKIKEQNDRE